MDAESIFNIRNQRDRACLETRLTTHSKSVKSVNLQSMMPFIAMAICFVVEFL